MKSFKYLKSNIFLLLVSAFFFYNFANIASAATLIFSPQTGTYAKGSSIVVNVLVSSSDKTMNAASGVVSFPTNLLSVSSISKTGSIVNFWAQEPSFSNSLGTVNFEGVVLPPWYTGGSGKILTITFKAKEAGTANISFTSGSVLAADGIGTNIITGTGVASYVISNSSAVSAGNTGVPGAPRITSTTHPDSTKWYAAKDVNFSWNISKDILITNILIDRNAKSSPEVLYNPPIASKEVKNLRDGVWYFHVQLKNNNGWGGISDFKIQIDTEKPTSFSITEAKEKDSADSRVQFIFDAADKTSGIDHYEVQIDDNPVEIWIDDESKTYETPTLEDGVHKISVRAVDKAGNFIVNSINFSVKALGCSAVMKIGAWAINFITILIYSVILIMLLMFLLWYVWHKFFIIGKKLKKEVYEAENALHKAFDLLKESVQEQIETLEKVKSKRQLTEEEKNINKQLKKDLEDAEQYIKKEIEDIDKLVNKEDPRL